MFPVGDHDRSPRDAGADGLFPWTVSNSGSFRVKTCQRCYPETSADCQSGLSERPF